MTASGIFGFTRILLPDVILCLWISLAMYFFWRSLGEVNPSLMTALGFDICCALGVLTKGLVGASFRWRSFSLSVPHAEPSPSTSLASDYRSHWISHRRCSMAHPRRVKKSSPGRTRRDPLAGQCARIFVVLFRARTVRALFHAGARRIISIPCRCRSSGCCCLPLLLRGAFLR